MKMDFSLKEKMRCFIPDLLWRKARLYKIKWKQKKCKAELESLVLNLSIDYLSEIKPLKQFPDDKKLIWQYWGQGFDSSDMPGLVKVCLKSMEKHTSGYVLLRMSDENLSEYIQIPNWLENKKKVMSKAHFSDLLRCILLSLYGGLWFDASVFLTGDIPSYIFKSDFFMYRRDNSEEYKEYWENTFSYYWGYSPDFLVKSLIGIIYAKRGNRVISAFASMLLTFWKNNDRSPDYFFFQILIEEYFRKHPELMPETVNDTIPHLLRQFVNENPAPGGGNSVMCILSKTTVHSLNYKNDTALGHLLTLFPEYKECRF